MPGPPRKARASATTPSTASPASGRIAEGARQRDNLLAAGKQLGAIFDWVDRHGADEILSRMDRAASKRFRVHRVHAFALGRYLEPGGDGAPADRRIAWGSWPQVLRLVNAASNDASTTNPIAALHARLRADICAVELAGMPPQEIRLGQQRLRVWPDYGAYRRANG